MGLESKHAIHLYPISHRIYSVGLPSTVWASMWSAPLVGGGCQCSDVSDCAASGASDWGDSTCIISFYYFLSSASSLPTEKMKTRKHVICMFSSMTTSIL